MAISGHMQHTGGGLSRMVWKVLGGEDGGKRPCAVSGLSGGILGSSLFTWDMREGIAAGLGSNLPLRWSQHHVLILRCFCVPT